MLNRTNPIATLGQNIQFVAFWAHFGVAGLLVEHLPHLWTALIITGLSAIKEFWFDAKYEKAPPQTLMDGIEDFSGWVVGAWLLFWLTH